MSILATELEWPEGTKFFEVQCRLGIWDIDGWDADKAPDVKTLGGTVRITPRTPTGRIRILEPDGKYRVVVATPLTFNVDESTGKLVNTADNTEGVWVVDPTSDTVDPNGFTYSAVVTPKVGSPFTVEFDGSVAINGVYDLANGATVVPSKGVSALDSRIAKLEQDVGSLDVTTTTLGQEVGNLSSTTTELGKEVGNLSSTTTELGKEVGNLSGIATTLDHLLVGPGRPDTPSTTGGIVTGSEPVGAEYRSTDGAGTGAWVWMKRPTGWEVTDGDTGWRDITALFAGAAWPNRNGVSIRRIGSSVSYAATISKLTGGDSDFGEITHGFSSEAFIQVPIYKDGVVIGVSEVWSGEYTYLSFYYSDTTAEDQTGYFHLSWFTDSPWPTTLPGPPV